MTDYTVQPSDISDLVATERHAWAQRDDAELTARVTTRRHADGLASDETLAEAKEDERASTKAWHDAYKAMQAALVTALTERGFDMASVTRIVRAMPL